MDAMRLMPALGISNDVIAGAEAMWRSAISAGSWKNTTRAIAYPDSGPGERKLMERTLCRDYQEISGAATAAHCRRLCLIDNTVCGSWRHWPRAIRLKKARLMSSMPAHIRKSPKAKEACSMRMAACGLVDIYRNRL